MEEVTRQRIVASRRRTKNQRELHGKRVGFDPNVPRDWCRDYRAFGTTSSPELRRPEEMNAFEEKLGGLYPAQQLAARFQSAVVAELWQRCQQRGLRDWTALAAEVPFDRHTLAKLTGGARPMTLAQLSALQAVVGQMVFFESPEVRVGRLGRETPEDGR